MQQCGGQNSFVLTHVVIEANHFAFSGDPHARNSAPPQKLIWGKIKRCYYYPLSDPMAFSYLTETIATPSPPPPPKIPTIPFQHSSPDTGDKTLGVLE